LGNTVLSSLSIRLRWKRQWTKEEQTLYFSETVLFKYSTALLMFSLLYISCSSPNPLLSFLRLVSSKEREEKQASGATDTNRKRKKTFSIKTRFNISLIITNQLKIAPSKPIPCQLGCLLPNFALVACFQRTSTLKNHSSSLLPGFYFSLATYIPVVVIFSKYV